MTSKEKEVRWERMAKAVAGGASIADVARAEHVHERSVKDACNRQGVPFSVKLDPMGLGFRILKHLMRGGRSCQAIARHKSVGCSRGYIYQVIRIARDAGWTLHSQYRDIGRKRAPKT